MRGLRSHGRASRLLVTERKKATVPRADASTGVADTLGDGRRPGDDRGPRGDCRPTGNEPSAWLTVARGDSAGKVLMEREQPVAAARRSRSSQASCRPVITRSSRRCTANQVRLAERHPAVVGHPTGQGQRHVERQRLPRRRRQGGLPAGRFQRQRPTERDARSRVHGAHAYNAVRRLPRHAAQ